MNLNGIVNFEGSCIICFITCLFFIILTYHCDYIKENIIRKLQKLYSPSRNLRAFNKSLMLFFRKHLCTGDTYCLHAKYSLKGLYFLRYFIVCF